MVMLIVSSELRLLPLGEAGVGTCSASIRLSAVEDRNLLDEAGMHLLRYQRRSDLPNQVSQSQAGGI